MKKEYGFTLIELLVVIAIIAVLAGILVPTLGSVQDKALRAKVKTTVNQLSQAVKAYETDHGHYPLMASNGGVTQGSGYLYRNDVLIPNLDGDTSNGGPVIQYFEFTEQDCRKGTNSKETIYMDHFGEDIWYYNFHGHTPRITGKIVDTAQAKANPLHPWYNVVFFRGIQIYTQANFPNDPYDAKSGKGVSADTFQWITNYSN